MQALPSNTDHIVSSSIWPVPTRTLILPPSNYSSNPYKVLSCIGIHSGKTPNMSQSTSKEREDRPPKRKVSLTTHKPSKRIKSNQKGSIPLVTTEDLASILSANPKTQVTPAKIDLHLSNESIHRSFVDIISPRRSYFSRLLWVRIEINLVLFQIDAKDAQNLVELIDSCAWLPSLRHFEVAVDIESPVKDAEREEMAHSG